MFFQESPCAFGDIRASGDILLGGKCHLIGTKKLSGQKSCSDNKIFQTNFFVCVVNASVFFCLFFCSIHMALDLLS